MARHARTAFLFACLAGFIVSRRSNRRDAFGRLKSLCVAKFYLWCEYGTRNMNPIIVSGTFERLPRIDRFV
jgi:hypothetical protein